jgi:hypothetical protein
MEFSITSGVGCFRNQSVLKKKKANSRQVTSSDMEAAYSSFLTPADACQPTPTKLYLAAKCVSPICEGDNQYTQDTQACYTRELTCTYLIVAFTTEFDYRPVKLSAITSGSVSRSLSSHTHTHTHSRH